MDVVFFFVSYPRHVVELLRHQKTKERGGRSDRHDGPAVLCYRRLFAVSKTILNGGLLLLSCPVALALWVGHTCPVAAV